MKPSAECTSIDDIRSCIDEIDERIIDLIRSRENYVLAAASFKSSTADVRAEDRVKSMLEKRRAWALEKKCDPDFIEALFKMTVEHFIGAEMKRWSGPGDLKGGTAREISIIDAASTDASAILSLQKRAFLQEAEKHGDNYNIAPITERLPNMLEAFNTHIFLKALRGSLIVGSVRAQVKNETCLIGRLIVEPVFQRRGYGRALLDALEARFAGVRRFELFTGKESADDVRLYTKAGYAIVGEFANNDGIRMVTMEKINTKKSDAS